MGVNEWAALMELSKNIPFVGGLVIGLVFLGFIAYPFIRKKLEEQENSSAALERMDRLGEGQEKLYLNAIAESDRLRTLAENAHKLAEQYRIERNVANEERDRALAREKIWAEKLNALTLQVEALKSTINTLQEQISVLQTRTY